MYLYVVTRTVNQQDVIKNSTMRPMYGNDKNCQSTYMQPKKPISNMQSMTKSHSKWLSKPARKQIFHKNCQSIKSFKKICPV